MQSDYNTPTHPTTIYLNTPHLTQNSEKAKKSGSPFFNPISIFNPQIRQTEKPPVKKASAFSPAGAGNAAIRLTDQQQHSANQRLYRAINPSIGAEFPID
ncbi:hypothetical protein QQ045_006079 [Rhodiola kirilowii]